MVEEGSEGDSSPSTPRHTHMPSLDEASISTAGSPLIQSQERKKKSGGKLQFAFNLLKGGKHDTQEDEWDELDDSTEETTTRAIDSDTRSRVSARAAGQKFKQKTSLSVETNVIEPVERSLELHFVQNYLPPRKVVSLKGKLRIGNKGL